MGNSFSLSIFITHTIITKIGRDNKFSAEFCILRTVEGACPYGFGNFLMRSWAKQVLFSSFYKHRRKGLRVDPYEEIVWVVYMIARRVDKALVFVKLFLQRSHIEEGNAVPLKLL